MAPQRPLGAIVLALLLALFLPAPSRATEECDEDPARLVAEAEMLFVVLPKANEFALHRARDLYRRARLQAPSLALTFRSADLAAVADDDDELGRLLLAAARDAGEMLSPFERLLLARQAEARGDRSAAILQYGHVLAARERRGAGSPPWIGERIRRLDVEEEARAIPVRGGYPPPTEEARRAFAEGKAALAGKSGPVTSSRAREAFRGALRASPGYVEAALALGALEMREGRTSEAIAAYRTALAADPDRFEGVLSLANALWAEPDRQAKEESLALLDRALSLRPDATRLYREAAERWAAWGDAARALERLDAHRLRGGEAARKETAVLKERLVASVSHPGAAVAAALPELSSAALEPYRLAQVYARKGDAASLESAAGLLTEAIRLDPGFVPALELQAAVSELSGDTKGAEDGLRRALAADPTRATAHERLAALLSSQKGRESEAAAAWELAEKAGSREAVFRLAEAAQAAGRGSEAERLFRRYLDEVSDGPHAEEASRALARAASRRNLLDAAGGIAGFGALVAGAVWLYRRRSGLTLAEWLARDPERARDLRPAVGRLRHEAFKHGGLLLSEAASRLGRPGPERAATLSLLVSRLFGPPGREGPGLVAEARAALAEIADQARRRGVRLNLGRKDPVLAPVVAALDGLARARRDMEDLARHPAGVSRRRERRVEARVSAASAVLGAATGQRLGRVLDAASSTTVTREGFEAILVRAAQEAGVPLPALTLLGLLAGGNGRSLLVRVPPADWSTIWRNLFANALGAGGGTASGRVTGLAIHAEERRDPVTGQALARIVLADGSPLPLTAEMIRGRAAERGLGIVADLVRRHDGVVDVVPPPAGAEACVKGILVEVPALEGDER